MSSQRSPGKMGIKFFLRISQASYSSEEENKQWIVHQRGKAGKLRKVRRIRFSASSSPLPSHYSFITGDLWYYRNGPSGAGFCLDRSLFSPKGGDSAAADADGKHSTTGWCPKLKSVQKWEKIGTNWQNRIFPILAHPDEWNSFFLHLMKHCNFCTNKKSPLSIFNIIS